MSSVTRFIRQIPVSTTYYSAASIINGAALVDTNVFEFVPLGSNYVGNYPPGSMTGPSAQLTAALTQAIQNANAAGAVLVLRDMGKTVQAVYDHSVTPSAAPLTYSSSSTIGFFRQVQLLRPSALTYGQGTIGGLNGSNFGVLGSNNVPDNYTDFLTFYIPVSVAGVCAPAALPVNVIAGGQM